MKPELINKALEKLAAPRPYMTSFRGGMGGQRMSAKPSIGAPAINKTLANGRGGRMLSPKADVKPIANMKPLTGNIRSFNTGSHMKATRTLGQNSRNFMR